MLKKNQTTVSQFNMSSQVTDVVYLIFFNLSWYDCYFWFTTILAGLKRLCGNIKVVEAGKIYPQLIKICLFNLSVSICKSNFPVTTLSGFPWLMWGSGCCSSSVEVASRAQAPKEETHAPAFTVPFQTGSKWVNCSWEGNCPWAGRFFLMLALKCLITSHKSDLTIASSVSLRKISGQHVGPFPFLSRQSYLADDC